MTTEIPNQNGQQRCQKPTPLPKFQLFIIYLIQLAEPITALVIYPFVNELVRKTGVTNGDETKTGYYAGVIESAFFLAECLTVVQWGYLSDRYGRRTVLLIGPLGLSISMLFFGLSTTFWSLVIFRSFQGTFNGNIGVSKTVVAEITDDTNIGDACVYVQTMWGTGSTIAPAIGGILSQPAERWPDTFGRIAFFRRYPYFFPCAASAFLAFLSFAVALFGLKETLPSLVAKREIDGERSLLNQEDSVKYGTTVSVACQNPALAGEPTYSITEIGNGRFYTLTHRPLVLVFINYMFMAFLGMANVALVPLMYSTPLEHGGLGLTPFHIGTALGCFAIMSAIFQAKFLGILMRTLGRRRLYQVGMSSFVISFAMFPITKHLAQKAGGVDVLVCICIAIQLASRAGVSVAYVTIQVLIIQSVPEGGLLGTATGFGQMVGCGMRTIAPSLATSLFSISLQRNLAGGNLVYYVLLGVTVLGIRLSFLIVEPPRRKEST